MSEGRIAFQYRAMRLDGSVERGRVDAADARDAAAALAGRGLHPLRLSPMARTSRRRPASRQELGMLFRSLASLVELGVPLERALTMSLGVTRGRLREVLVTAQRLLQEGRPLSQGLNAGDGVVPGLVIGMVRAGERGGRLADALGSVADQLEREAELMSRVRQALTYPVLVALVGSVSMVVIGVVVIPRFVALLSDLGQKAPAGARLLVAGAAVLTRYGPLLAIAAAVLVASLLTWREQPAGRRRLDGWLIRLPLVGRVRHTLSTARFVRALAGTLTAGMPLLPAFDAAAEAVGDGCVTERLQVARALVAQGQPLARSLTAAAALTPSAIDLLAIGEASGRLAVMAERAGALAARDADHMLRAATTLLEPALIVAFGGAVACVAAALLQAVYSLRPGA